MADDWKWYFNELKSDGCMCGGTKKPGHSFCYGCYRKLPPEMQRALYRRIGSGYEEAYNQACVFLTGEGA